MTRAVQKHINVKPDHMLYTLYIQHRILKQNIRKINVFSDKYYYIKINLVTRIIIVKRRIKKVSFL